MNTNNNDSLLNAIQNLLEQQRQESANMHHGMLHQIYQQLEAFITINKLLEIRHPLPPMRGWAASPDFLVLVLGEILARKPNLVVELGSGVSTLINAYALEKLGNGKLISLDHDSEFLQKTQRQIDLHGLNDVVQAVHAPLTKINLNGADWQWYDLASADITSPVDILVVDGPPGDLQARSRYPALPLFAEQLSSDAAVFLDDVARSDEQAIVQEWAMQYPEFSRELVNCEKGAAIFRLTSML
jgi:predicted O-methyltransferase YrrM